ncbi:MAG: DUF924 family protein, partial [Novosphingobium sp.]|uniref:DUF924 family protein n=1 Tax=Novosphingobium sp. TaxID=1874826 RepID=UPI0032BB29F7
MPSPDEVIAFWQEAGPERWFAKDDAFDTAIRQRFEGWHHAAARGEMPGWLESWEGSLALLLLLDQFPRNLFRGSAHSYAADPLARSIAAPALAAGHDRQAPAALAVFYYLPFEHSEDLADQETREHRLALLVRHHVADPRHRPRDDRGGRGAGQCTCQRQH